MESLSPERLVTLVQETLPGDHRAFEQLVTRYKAMVYATALRLMENHADADDQTQDIFVKVYHQIHDLSDPVAFPAWLSRITVTTCLNALRRQRRLRTMSIEPALDTLTQEVTAPLGTPLPEAIALANELRQCIEEALAELGDEARVLLLLRDVEAYSYQEIGRSFQLNLGAVKMRVHRTRVAFRRIFLRVCPDLWQPISSDRT